jgi:hypothetical protein
MSKLAQGCKGYQMSRRTLFGAAGATVLGMNLKNMVSLAQTPDAKAAAKAEHVVFFWCGGGMSHIDTWDPKPGRPTAGEFSPIKTSADGVQISEIFPTVAKQMHHGALIRSIAGTNGDHGRASYQMQTSYNQSGNLTHPGFGSVVVHEKESVSDLPSYISISGQARRASYLGQQCEAYYVGLPGQKDPYLQFPEGINHARGNKRLEILKRLNGKFGKQNADPRLTATQTSVDDAVRLMRSPALKAFELKNEKPETVARYGDNAYGRGALLARRLVESGVRFVQVNRGGFDNHGNIFPAMTNHGAVMDPAIGSLIADLNTSGLLSKTLVVVLSEFGRTPRINDNAGRDHWARVFSCLIAGGGIKGGQVIGSSDIDGMAPKDRPVKVPELHATLCHAMGINFHKKVMTPLQRPMRLVDEPGKPIKELFA